MIDADPRTGAAGWIGDPVVMAPDIRGNVGLDPHGFARAPGLAVPVGAIPARQRCRTRAAPWLHAQGHWSSTRTTMYHHDRPGRGAHRDRRRPADRVARPVPVLARSIRAAPGRRRAEPEGSGYTHLPFGGGPRACIGEHLAMAALVAAVAAMVRRYRLRSLLTPPGTEVDLALPPPGRTALPPGADRGPTLRRVPVACPGL